jgi:hypothetical protein
MTDRRHPRSRELYPRRCVGHIEREPGRLQLRLVLYPGEHVCDIELEEDDEAVVAFATVCGPVEDDEHGDACEVPCHVYSSARSAIAPCAMGTSGMRSRIAISTRSSKPGSGARSTPMTLADYAAARVNRSNRASSLAGSGRSSGAPRCRTARR